MQYIDKHGLSITTFENKAGFSNGYLINTRKRGADLTNKALIKLRENQPEHYYKIFPEEKETEQNVNENVPDYKAHSGVFATTDGVGLHEILSKCLDVISGQQKTIGDQQTTIHEMFTTWGGEKRKAT